LSAWTQKRPVKILKRDLLSVAGREGRSKPRRRGFAALARTTGQNLPAPLYDLAPDN
jgi:hypothetical protein